MDEDHKETHERAKNRSARELQGERLRERERRTHREPGGETRGYYRPGIVQVTRDVERLAYAWTRANTEMLFGATQVLGDLILNLADSLYGQSTGRYEEEVDTNRHVRHEESSYEPSRARRRSSRRADVFEDFSNDLSEAVRNTADVFARSADNFSRVFEQETEYDDERADPNSSGIKTQEETESGRGKKRGESTT
jgi:hypothetical protein